MRFAYPVALVLAVLACEAPAAATTSQDAVSFLKQQRHANGIPDAVAFDQYRTTGCHNHVGYMHQNGLGHGEDASKPGYTPEGADYTGSGEVLTQGIVGWTAGSNPWDRAPLHQTLLFDPEVNSAGYFEDDEFACMRFGFDFLAPTQPAFYAYTGDLGRTNVPFRLVVANEGPYAPQEAVGIPQGVPTGPNIIFFTEDFGSSNHAALYSLTGPGKRPISVKMVDSTVPPPHGSNFQAFGTGGDMIPVKPLDPATSYTAKVVWHNDDNGQNVPQTVTFTTAGQRRVLTLSLSKNLSKGRKAKLSVPGAAVGRRALLAVRVNKGKTTRKGLKLKRSQRIAVPKPPAHGTVLLRVTLPTFFVGATRYDAKTVTRTYR